MCECFENLSFLSITIDLEMVSFRLAVAEFVTDVLFAFYLPSFESVYSETAIRLHGSS